MSAVNPTGPVRVVALNAVASGTSIPIEAGARLNWTAYIKGSAALSAGTLLVEEADFDPSNDTVPATWSTVVSVTLATPFASAGGQYANHLPAATYSYLRARVGTSVTGGTITVVLKGS